MSENPWLSQMLRRAHGPPGGLRTTERSKADRLGDTFANQELDVCRHVPPPFSFLILRIYINTHCVTNCIFAFRASKGEYLHGGRKTKGNSVVILHRFG